MLSAVQHLLGSEGCRQGERLQNTGKRWFEAKCWLMEARGDKAFLCSWGLAMAGLFTLTAQ